MLRPLPVSSPNAAHRLIESAAKQGEGVRTVGPPTMIFHPRGVVRILVKVAVAHMVMLAANHAAKAREEAFNPIRMLAVAFAVEFAVVDAGDRVIQFQRIPMARLV